MSEIKFRINELLHELFENNKSEMARQLNSNATSIRMYVEGKHFPGFEFFYELCYKYNINPIWLVLGIGEKRIPESINNVNGNGNNVGYQKIGNYNSNITQVMHSNDILHSENEALKRENTLLREMVELYKNQSEK